MEMNLTESLTANPPEHLNLSHSLLLRAGVGTDGATVRAEEIQTGCFPFVLGPVSTTLRHFFPERRYCERIWGLGWELPSQEAGSIFFHVLLYMSFVIFFDKSTELAG